MDRKTSQYDRPDRQTLERLREELLRLIAANEARRKLWRQSALRLNIGLAGR